MKRTPSQSRIPGLMTNALVTAVAVSVPTFAAEQEGVKELPAAQAQGQTEDSYKVDQSTSHKYTQPLLDTAKTITVIPQAILKDRNVDNLRDALRNVPGISMAAGEGGTPAGDSMSIRGFSTQNDILIDGVRDIAGYSRDIYNVESVEVAKGPGSAVYGRGATGGSINLQSKTAKLEDFADLTARIGTEADYRAHADINRKLGETTALRVNLLVDDGDVPGRDEVYNSKYAGAISFAAGLGTRSRFNVNAEYQNQDNMPDYGLPWVFNSATADPVAELADSEGKIAPVKFSNFYGNIFRDYEDIEAMSVTAKYEYDLSSSTTLRALGRLGSVAREGVVTAPRFISLATSTDVRQSDEKTRDTKDSLAVFQFDILGEYQTGSIKHNVVAGVELAREKFKRWNFVDLVDDNLDSTPVLVDLYNPDSHIAFTGVYGRDGTSQLAKGDTTAAYLFDTLTLSPAWQVSAGLRWDHFETEYQYDYADPSLVLETSDDKLSWNAGLVFKPAQNGSVYFGAGTSFSPSAEDLTASTNGNNADLNPEETISYELGTKWELIEGKLFTSAAIFRTEKRHARTDDPFAEDSADETLNGKQRVDGIELSAAGQLTDQFNLTAAYTFQDSKVVNAEGDDAGQIGNALARTPKHSFSLWGRFDFTEQLAMGAGAQYVSKVYNSTVTETRESADAYIVFDMMASYKVDERWNLQLNANNLFNERYIDQVGGGHGIPGEGRSVTMSARYSF